MTDIETLASPVGEAIAWPVVVSHCLAVLLLIHVAATRLLRAAVLAKTQRSRWTWICLILVTATCGTCGYASPVLSQWYPEVARVLVEWSSYATVAATAAFTAVSRHKRLIAVATDTVREDLTELLKLHTIEDILRALKDHV